MSNPSKKQEQPTSAAERTHSGPTFTPQIDIFETESELLLHADVAGVRPEDLHIHYENGELDIDAKVAARHEGIEYAYSEYAIGDFHRRFQVGDTMDTEKITAELKHGVLTLHLPKMKKLKPRRIEVRAS